MNLYIVHAGYYDSEIGIYELHTNFLIVAPTVNEVKKRVKEKDIFMKKNMHIDAIQEIEIVDGYRITLVENQSNSTKPITYDYSQVKKS